jgi:hypothetical protein
MLARKKRAALLRRRQALELAKRPVEVKVLPPTAKKLVKLRGAGRINTYVPTLAHRSMRDEVHRPDPGSHRDITSRIEKLTYTGDKLIGIALMHKSNYVPIFNHEEAVSVTKMRRN